MSNAENTPTSTMTTTLTCKDSNLTVDSSIFTDESFRVDELKKTIIFLKEEQKRMLNSLHQEIAWLQIRNRGKIIVILM